MRDDWFSERLAQDVPSQALGSLRQLRTARQQLCSGRMQERGRREIACRIAAGRLGEDRLGRISLALGIGSIAGRPDLGQDPIVLGRIP